jgi:hypothetical protein
MRKSWVMDVPELRGLDSPLLGPEHVDDPLVDIGDDSSAEESGLTPAEGADASDQTTSIQDVRGGTDIPGPDTPTEAGAVRPETPNSDWEKDGLAALGEVQSLLGDTRKELPRLKNRELREEVKALIDRPDIKIAALIKQGAKASASQLLVVVLTYSGSEEELAAKTQVSDADREVLNYIQDKFLKGRIPSGLLLPALVRLKSGQRDSKSAQVFLQ